MFGFFRELDDAWFASRWIAQNIIPSQFGNVKSQVLTSSVTNHGARHHTIICNSWITSPQLMGRVTRLKPEEPKGPSVPRWLRPKVYSPLSPKEIYEMNLAVQQRKINDLVSEIRQIATQREKLTSRIKEIKHSINWVQISIDERMNRYYVYADPGRSAYWLQIAEEGRRELERKNRVLKRLMEDVAKLSKKIDDLKKQILVERGVKREPLAICAP